MTITLLNTNGSLVNNNNMTEVNKSINLTLWQDQQLGTEAPRTDPRSYESNYSLN